MGCCCLFGKPQNGGGGNFACELKGNLFSPHPMNTLFSGRKGDKKLWNSLQQGHGALVGKVWARFKSFPALWAHGCAPVCLLCQHTVLVYLCNQGQLIGWAVQHVEHDDVNFNWNGYHYSWDKFIFCFTMCDHVAFFLYWFLRLLKTLKCLGANHDTKPKVIIN